MEPGLAIKSHPIGKENAISISRKNICFLSDMKKNHFFKNGTLEIVGESQMHKSYFYFTEQEKQAQNKMLQVVPPLV